MGFEYDSIPVKHSVYYKGENPLSGENTVTIRLEDEGGGCFFVLSDAEGEIKVDPEQLQILAGIAGKMSRDYKGEGS